MTLIDPKTAADQLNVSLSMVYKLVNQGEIPALKVGTRTRIPQDGLDRWIAQQLGDRGCPDADQAKELSSNARTAAGLRSIR